MLVVWRVSVGTYSSVVLRLLWDMKLLTASTTKVSLLMHVYMVYTVADNNETDLSNSRETCHCVLEYQSSSCDLMLCTTNQWRQKQFASGT